MGGDDLPLDIHFAKLIETLLDHKKLPEQWQDSLKEVKSRVKAFGRSADLPDLPAVHGLLRGSCTYFDCVTIIKLLEAHEVESGNDLKNFLGQYNSAVLKSLSDILKAYEKQNLHLGEAARVMTQNTTYEIPALKKTMQQNEKQLSDLKKKAEQYGKSITEVSGEFFCC